MHSVFSFMFLWKSCPEPTRTQSYIGVEVLTKICSDFEKLTCREHEYITKILTKAHQLITVKV